MTTLNLNVANIATITTASSLTIHKASSLNKIDYTVYLMNGDVVEFSYLSAGIKLLGISKLNGKRVAVKEAVQSSDWFNAFNGALIRNDELSTKLLNATLYNNGEKLVLLKEESCEFKPTATALVTFEESLYKGLQGYKYDNFNINTLESWLKVTWANLKTNLEGTDYDTAKDMIVHIRNSMIKFNEDYPQFRGSVKKGIVLNAFYQVSSLYGSKYKELNIERKATYNYGLFLARLFGYLNFRTKQKFDSVEFKDMIINFVHRENPFIQAEDDDKLKADIKALYKSFITNTVTSDYVLKANAMNVLQSLTQAAP